MAIVRDGVSGVLLEAEKGGAKSLQRQQWGVLWVLGLAVYGRMLVKEIAGVTVRWFTTGRRARTFLSFRACGFWIDLPFQAKDESYCGLWGPWRQNDTR